MEPGEKQTVGSRGSSTKAAEMGRGNVSRQVGLARALSKLGYCSRSQAAKLIREGRVRLNGATRRDPETAVRMESDRIEVDRNAVTAESKIYLMLNKPRGVVTTASDEKGRATVYSFLDETLPWVGTRGPARQSERRAPAAHERLGMGRANFRSRFASRTKFTTSTWAGWLGKRWQPHSSRA